MDLHHRAVLNIFERYGRGLDRFTVKEYFALIAAEERVLVAKATQGGK